MELTKEKIIILLKKVYPFALTFFFSMAIGALCGFYLNPKCGEFNEKSKYLTNIFKEIFLETEKEIIEVPIECNCPECIETEEEIVKDNCPIKVDISGAIKDPGVYCFQDGSVIMDAVTSAGGFKTDYGDKYIYRKINLARELEDNQKIYFPFKEDLVCELQSFSPEVEEVVVITNSATENSETEKSTEKEDSSDTTNKEEEGNEGNSDCISINNASTEELMELNGVGESTAQKIVDGRPYSILEDLLNVSGIGDATFEKIENDICL